MNKDEDKSPPPEVVVSPVGLQPLAKMQVQEQTNCIRFRPDAFVIGTSAYRHINPGWFHNRTDWWVP